MESLWFPGRPRRAPDAGPEWRRYPQEARGRCFMERQGRRWLIINPWENVNKETDFQIPFYTNTCEGLSGVLPPHTFAIVEESPEEIQIYLSNFRLDKDELWDKRHTPSMVRQIVADAEAHPERALRKTTLVLRGHAGAKAPALVIDGHEGSMHTNRWDQKQKRYELAVTHNGIVRIALKASGNGGSKQPPQGLSRNLCLLRPVQASSKKDGFPPEHAVDGAHSTAWAPGAAESAWLTVDLGEPTEITAYKALFEPVTNGRKVEIAVQGAMEINGPWTTLHQSSAEGARLLVRPIEAKSRHRYCRLAIEAPSDGLLVREFGIYSGPNDALRQWAPLAEPTDLQAILKLLPGRKCFLIVDGHPVHKSAAVKRWLAQRTAQIEMFLLPGYSPELNPDELLNQDVKSNALGRQRPADQKQMMHLARTYLRSTQRQPETVRSYFREEHVRYAAEPGMFNYL